MDPDWRTPHHRKRKRRRPQDRPPIAAELLFDSKLQGDIALVPEDLFNDLFPLFCSDYSRKIGPGNAGAGTYHCYAAIQPRTPGSQARPDFGHWTILQAQISSAASFTKLASQSSIRISTSSSAFRHFYAAQPHDYSRSSSPSSLEPVDIYIIDVSPIPLETVVVYIDDDSLSKDGAPRNALLRAKTTQEEDRVQAVRNALGLTNVVRSGDVLELAINTKETLEALAAVEFCKPVSQGTLCEHTNIVISRVSRRIRPVNVSNRLPLSNGIMEEQDDTSNEQFYSATEDITASLTPLKSNGPNRYPPNASKYQQHSSGSERSISSETDLSDSDSEAVGLTLPNLPTQAAGILPEFSSVSPDGSQFIINGTSSPGPVVSHLSTSTMRAGRNRVKTFSTQELLSRISDEYLQPKPLPHEDEEARIFTDAAALAKLGCFSGDWVRLEPVTPGLLDGKRSWESVTPGSATEQLSNWRPVKIYASPYSFPRRLEYAINKSDHRAFRDSAEHGGRKSLEVFMSPILLANIGSPGMVRICGLVSRIVGRARKGEQPTSPVTSDSLPPFAREAAILKLATPLGTERYISQSLFQGLRRYFAVKRRIVKPGDLIGFTVDDDLGHAMYQGSSGNEDGEQDDLFMKDDPLADNQNPSAARVAWFRVRSHSIDISKGTTDIDDTNIWGGAATIISGTIRLAQAGSETGKILPTLSSKWPFYLGLNRLPTPQMSQADTRIPARISQSYVSETRRRLRELISVATSPQAVHFKMPPATVLLSSTQKHIGKATSALNACADLGLHTFTIDAFDILSEGGAAGGDINSAAFLESRAERALNCGAEFTALLIKHIDALTTDRMVRSLQNILATCRVLMATTTDLDKVHESVRGLFVHEIQISAPDEKEREGLLRDIVQSSGISVAHDVDMSSVALKTAALVAGDLVDVVDRAVVARGERLEKLAMTSNSKHASSDNKIVVRDLQLAGGDASRCVIKADFDVAVDAARKNFADAIGAPKIPNVTWDDVGGLSNVKDAVMETIQLPLERPELFAKGMKKRSGILFYGPPGTGKTLLAKAIATEFSLNFFSVKGPEMLNMYIGESEANVRRVFQRARDARPCVVFFDELDSVAPRRGKSGDSQGVMDRIVSQLLAELDGMSDGDGGGVFVIGATNRPDLLDQALLRPGRFDKMLYLGVSDTHEKQLTILEALTRKFTLHPDLALSKVAASLSFTYTGADLYALCSDAMLKAITRRATSVDNQIRAINTKRAASTPKLKPITVAYFFDHLATQADTEVVVGFEDFQSAIRELVPSVSVKELEHYNKVREEFEKGEEKKEELVVRSDILTRLKERSESRIVWDNGDARGGQPGQQPVDDEDYILRTDGLSLSESHSTNGFHANGWDGSEGHENGEGKGKGKENGKGKGKFVEPADPGQNGFGNATDGDEDMYNM